MIIEYDWRDTDHNIYYYYVKNTGRIVGQVYNLAHTKIYGAKIYRLDNEEQYLGQYINSEHAKNAVLDYWQIQSRTLIE